MMIENMYIENFENFMEWFSNINPAEIPDMNEAITIYFNTETYDLGEI